MGSRRDWRGIGNRGEPEQPKEQVPFLPPSALVKRAMAFHQLASQFRSVAVGIQDAAPERAKELNKRARLMSLRAAMMLLGEDEKDDE